MCIDFLIRSQVCHCSLAKCCNYFYTEPMVTVATIKKMSKLMLLSRLYLIKIYGAAFVDYHLRNAIQLYLRASLVDMKFVLHVWCIEFSVNE